jgi:hypothetical protein
MALSVRSHFTPTAEQVLQHPPSTTPSLYACPEDIRFLHEGKLE